MPAIRLVTLLVTSLALACSLLPHARASDGYVYGVFFKGLACYKESKHFLGQKADEPFIVIFIRNSKGKMTKHKVLPGGKYVCFEAMNQGDVKPYNFLVWHGPVQNLDLGIMLWEYNRKGRKALGLLLDIGTVSGLAGGLLLAAASGPISGAAEAGPILAQLNQDLKKQLKKKGADFMGSVVKPIHLGRVGRLGDGPTQQMKGVRYDFHTEHRGNGAHYRLFWEVKRHKLR